jgi:FkbM family methyltransferase
MVRAVPLAVAKPRIAGKGNVASPKMPAVAPKSVPMPKKPDFVPPPYDEVIETQGIKVPFVPAIITPNIERPMRNNRYEGGECANLRRVLRPGDRVLELGAGVGLLSTISAQVPGVELVVAVEANPDLIPLIRETHRLNNITNVDLRNGIAAATDGEDVTFYLRPDFWASSMDAGPHRYSRTVQLKQLGIKGLMADVKPTVIVCDIEGGENGLFDEADLSGVRAMVLELHPKVYGEAQRDRILALLAAKGLKLDADNRLGSTVQLLTRAEVAQPVAAALPARRFRDWPITDPRVFVATCMKDEGPFILEWLAWHRAVGVTDFVVFTNDCTDGTDRLLDHLQDMGELTHLPNPALAMNDTHFQPIALNYAHHMRQMREADFFLSIDVDEFVNVRVGDGKITDLIDVAGFFDVLSMTELNHGSNRQEHFEPGWLKDLFPLHQTERPGKMRSRRGVKSLVRLSDKVAKLRNHRPDMITVDGPVIWRDGSGRPQTTLLADASENGVDSRGTYDLVSLDHYALRSLDSYLVKMFRGDVVVTGKQVSQAYWRTRNRNEDATSTFTCADAAARAYHATRFEADPKLMALHADCVAAHRARIAALVTSRAFAARRHWALTEAW